MKWPFMSLFVLSFKEEYRAIFWNGHRILFRGCTKDIINALGTDPRPLSLPDTLTVAHVENPSWNDLCF